MRDKESSKEKILSTALKLFLSKPYSKVSVDEIARKSGFSKGAVFHYFKSKLEIAENVLQILVAKIVALPLKRIIYSDKSFREKIYDIIGLALNFSLKHDLKTIVFLAGLYYELKACGREFFLGMAYDSLQQVVYEFFKENNVSNPKVKALIFTAILDGLSVQCMIASEVFRNNDFVLKIKEEIYNFVRC